MARGHEGRGHVSRGHVARSYMCPGHMGPGHRDHWEERMAVACESGYLEPIPARLNIRKRIRITATRKAIMRRIVNIKLGCGWG